MFDSCFNILHCAILDCECSVSCIVDNKSVVGVLNGQVLKRCIIYSGCEVYCVVGTILNRYVLDRYAICSGRYVEEGVHIIDYSTILNNNRISSLEEEGICVLAFSVKGTILDGVIALSGFSALCKTTVDEVNILYGYSQIVIYGHRTGVLKATAVDCEVLVDRYALVYVSNELNSIACICSCDCGCEGCVLGCTDLCYRYESRNIISNVTVATIIAGMSCVTQGLECRLCYHRSVAVAICRNNNIFNFCLAFLFCKVSAAVCAVVMFNITVGCAICILRKNMLKVMGHNFPAIRVLTYVVSCRDSNLTVLS